MENSSLSDDHKKELFAMISHELLSPIVGMRNDVSFLQRRIWELDRETVERKLEDIFYDSEILLHILEELDILLGLSSRTHKSETILFFRDILLRTIQSIKPFLAERGFNVSQIFIDDADAEIQKPIVTADKEKLKLVVFNLLHNSITYAHKDPKEFRIQIQQGETSSNYIIKFKDWGIGINSEYEQQVFKKEFVLPERMKNNIHLLWSKLSLSKRIMLEMGGDLKLINGINPTEFHMILPKKPISK